MKEELTIILYVNYDIIIMMCESVLFFLGTILFETQVFSSILGVLWTETYTYLTYKLSPKLNLINQLKYLPHSGSFDDAEHEFL